MLKKTLFVLLPLCCLLLAPRLALANQAQAPKRLSILPVSATVPISPELVHALSQRLRQELHVPLNGTLQVVEYIPEDEIQQSIKELGFNDHDLRQPENMKPLAEKLHADLLISLNVTDLYEYYYYGSWDHTLLLRSSAALRLIGYECRQDKTFVFKDRSSFWDDYSPSGLAAVLAGDSLDKILKQADLRQYIFPLSKTAAGKSPQEQAAA